MRSAEEAAAEYESKESSEHRVELKAETAKTAA